MATVEKIRKDIEKTKEKISAQQKRLRELEAQLTEEENLEIVRMVKAVRMDNKELTAFLKAYASGLITLPDGMMEAEAAPDRDDAGTHRGTRHRGHGAGGPAPYPGGQRHAGGRLLRRQTAYHRDHKSGQLFLHPDRPGQRGQGDRRSLLEPGG